MRKGKRSRPGGQAWIFALAIPGVALFMLFSLLPYEAMLGQWPLGIRKGEVMAYQALFDYRPGQHKEGHADTYKLTDEGQGLVMLRTEGKEAKGTMVRLPGQAGQPEALRVDFSAEHPFGDALALAFVPADLHALEALYAQAVADSLPILSPGIKVVKLEREGGPLDPYLVQEAITPEYLLKHAAVAMVLVGPDGQVEEQAAYRSVDVDSIGEAAMPAPFPPDRFDTAATAALALLTCAEQRQELSKGTAGAMYDRVTGNILPLYHMPYSSRGAATAEALAHAFTKAMARAPNQRRVVRLAHQLQADSAAWAARFLTIDSAAVPVLAKGRNLGLVQAEVDRAREQFMHRLFHPGVAHWFGAPVEDVQQAAPALDPWLKPFLTDQDTLRFVRGKYHLDHDLVLPPGMAVVLERGARWYMAPGVSVVVNGELHIRGTKLNPVFIRAQRDSAFGSIAVNGDGQTRVRISGLRISGGGNLWFKGVRHGGMLSFIGADVRLDNCAIGESFGDAAVAARRCTFHISSCYLASAHHGYVDLAEVRGSVEACAFVQPATNSTATGRRALNMRACRILVNGSTFTELPFTAVRTARGGDALLQGCRFTGNGVAVKAADGALVHVDQCTFTGNGKDLVLRRTHPVLGGAVAKLYGNTFAVTGGKRDVDAASKVETAATLPPRVRKEFTAPPH